jgi:hypothetical protein
MNNIALGKYLPLDSIIHHMDPRAKIGAMLIMMIAIFIPAGYAGYCGCGHRNCTAGTFKAVLFMESNEADAVHADVSAHHQSAGHS